MFSKSSEYDSQYEYLDSFYQHILAAEDPVWFFCRTCYFYRYRPTGTDVLFIILL